nr:hypothetical protein SpFp1_00098 [Serratia proteamaculans]
MATNIKPSNQQMTTRGYRPAAKRYSNEPVS